MEAESSATHCQFGGAKYSELEFKLWWSLNSNSVKLMFFPPRWSKLCVNLFQKHVLDQSQFENKTL